jgi:hypothetical protein
MSQDTQRHSTPGRKGHGRPPNPRALRIAQCNVGKRPPAHTALLQLCFQEQVDVILAQEPWTGFGEKLLLNNHPGYDTFSPVDHWDSNDTRPRVLTYVWKGLVAQQLRPKPTRDILCLSIQGFTIVNIYRPHDDPDNHTTNILLEHRPPAGTVIAGDFNARHPMWEPGSQPTGTGNAIASWAERYDLQYIGEAGTSTHDKGHVLDLTFTNIPLAAAEIFPQIHPGADHEAILIVFPLTAALEERNTIRATVPDAHLERFTTLVGLNPLQEVQQGASTADLDRAAEAILGNLDSALQALTSRRKGKQRSAPLWNSSCEVARGDCHRARRFQTRTGQDDPSYHEDTEAVRKAFHQTVRLAKREYWNRKINNAASSEDLYRITSWQKRSLNIKPPPLVVNETTVEDTAGKAAALRTALLERFTAEDAETIPTVPRTSIPWSTKVSQDEARTATLTRSRTPGVDGITVRLLKAAWPHIGKPTRALFEACLTRGHFPQAFKQAEVIFLRKPGKRDPTSVGSFRPISRLSCGLPQGSPASPILYILYLAEALRTTCVASSATPTMSASWPSHPRWNKTPRYSRKRSPPYSSGEP